MYISSDQWMGDIQGVHLPGCHLAFHGQPLLSCQLLKVDNVFQVRDEANGIAAAVQTSGTNHPDVAHGVSWSH